ncbi:hypothetical protein EI94DRAFT_1698461 [Lactarius quietus]|nr:hypothetical protein EI94DRAFT_1698461 [Lactarius quietus]
MWMTALCWPVLKLDLCCRHVFLPPKLPQSAPVESAECETNVALCHILIQAARAFSQYLSPTQQLVWDQMMKMMVNIDWVVKAPPLEEELAGTLSDLVVGDIRSLPPAHIVVSTKGRLLCSYPGPAIQVSPEIFFNQCFLRELASFLIQMDVDVLDSTATAVKAGCSVPEVRESADPRYISKLLVGILRGFGQPASVDRITKRIGDEALLKRAHKPWRRSPLWLVVRCRKEDRDTPSRTVVKLSEEPIRFTGVAPRGVASGCRQRFLTHSRNSRPYLVNALHSTHHSYSPKKFRPSHRRRLANTDNFVLFLGGGLASAVAEDNRAALADFELSVERYLDNWVDACQHDDNALDVIAACIEEYLSIAREIYVNAEDNSAMILTVMDLWMALDTLTVLQCPLLGFYSPEVPKDFLHPLLLHRSGSLQRAMLIEEYILQRHERAFYPTSIFSDHVTESSFAIQYFRTSQRLQQLYVSITQRASEEQVQKLGELDSLNKQWQSLRDAASAMSHTYSTGKKGTLDPGHIQLVMFELSPPRVFSTWREVTYKILRDIGMPTAYGQATKTKALLRHLLWFETLDSASLLPPDHDRVYHDVVPRPKSLQGGSDSCHQLSGQPFIGSTIANFCTPLIPMSSPYNKIHTFASGTHHTSNALAQRAAFAMAKYSKGTVITLALISLFGWTLLHELERLLGRIEANWLEEVTVRSIALLTSRLLSSAGDADICQRAYALLRRARNVAHKWISELGSKLESIDDETARTNLRRRLCTLAATCFSTYDVCLEHVPWTLSSGSDIAIAVQCAVIVHDNTPSILEDEYLIRLLNRHRRLLHFLEPSLRETSQLTVDLLYVEGGQEVHYNLLTGQLLIGGDPFGRLPQDIIEHATYASVLGTRILDVVPADIPSMEFMTRSSVSGYQFVPREVFLDDFPKAFVDDCVHWLDLGTGEVEFRYDTQSMFRRTPGDSSTPVDLIDIRSATFRTISHKLSALDLPEHIIVTHTNEELEASLSRLRLVFFINHNSELECKSMPGYVIDELQSCGTMFGLKNQLVLRPSNSSSEMPRRVIIPRGDIEFGLDGDFSSVFIKTGMAQHVHWHEYTIDTDLGRLTGNVSLHSKLYQCYLHALTSHCLPDPLLGHTGTEESLNMLQSAAFLSFQRLGKEDAKLLELINNLTPSRVYHPPHLKTMVTVEWNGLPIFSQHHDFHLAVLAILDHAHAMEALYDEPVVFSIPRLEASLLIRTASRNKIYYPHDLQSLRHAYAPISDDIVYKSRDIADGEGAELAAYQMSRSAWNDRPCLSRESLELWDAMQSWKHRYWLTFDPKKNWLQLYDFCQEALLYVPQDIRVMLAFSLSAASFSGTKYADILPLIQIFATDPRFRDLTRPPEPHFVLSDGTYPNQGRLKKLISQFALPLQRTPAHNMKVRTSTRKKAKKNERKQEYDKSISELASKAADLAAVLNLYGTSVPPHAPYHFSPQFRARPPKASHPSLRELLMSRANYPQPQTREQSSPSYLMPSAVILAAESDPPSNGEDGLSSLIQELRHARESLIRLYGEDLNKSYSDLLGKRAPFLAQRGAPPQEALRYYRDFCSENKDAIFAEISEALAPSQRTEYVLHISGLLPRITPRSILRELSRDRVHTLTDQWKHAIIRYAVAFLKYQQSQRLLELSSRHRDEELLRESETVCEEVAATCSPDWLLIQIDANFLARPLQLAIAREMISPTCKRSASLQLNMGEGKSSVIVPLVIATLADGSNLARIVTLKPLSNQMYQLLLSRLSDLTDRRIFYVPFSRNLRMSTSVVQGISALYKRCAVEGGVLVTQPEYLLSQKLMCIDSLLSTHGNYKKLSVANELKALHDWLAKTSRDVLDESDEILHVRYQLVYTEGEQMPVEGHPNRWSTTQEVFGRLRVLAAELHVRFPKMFELDQTQKGFPMMRILDRELSQRISFLITEDALGGALSTLSLAVLSPSVREAARRFITQKEISYDDHQFIRSQCSGTTLWNGILLLRGLLVDGEGILGYVLKERRWRVDYGLDPSRTLLAVPYRAKTQDVPSLRAEFGHPDVAIALTCLSYYYGGLTKQQVLQCIDLLTKLDNPDMEYDQWIEMGEGIPTSLRQVNGINTNDDTQVDEHLVPLFSRNTKVIDFYLSKVVFPRAAKEFPSKLSTSAWDLVEDKPNVTTGFSGTNDNRYLLPTSITQEDPVSQLSTNALVLQYLLQSENNHYECTEGTNGERESAEAFLRRLVGHDPEIRVLLDVGAQMLELQNEDLARYWLSLKPHISAAIFFNESDHLTVLTQDGTIEPFISSPFNRQLEKCIVYLDDAHTRGTDLKLPRGTRAAVTLGPKVTKDRLLQGEVDRRIRGFIPQGQESENGVHAIDILRWAMHETCRDISHHLSHWAEQGVDHHRRSSAYKQYCLTGDLGALRNSWLQHESKTLEKMYEPVSSPQGTVFSREINGIPALRERLEQLGVTRLIDVRMAEEQEREVQHEVELERHLELPPKVFPAKHMVCEEILNFVGTGILAEPSRHIIPLLSPTKLDDALNSMRDWSPTPLATRDFAITTTNSSITRLTDYLRPVNWILSSGSGKKSIAIVISPYEANELLPIIRTSGKVRLHIYAPRITSSMRSFSDLTFYSIPESPPKKWTPAAHLQIELNLFAGQLYFDNEREYQRVCVLLALHMAHPGAGHIEVDGFVPPAHRTGQDSPFTTSAIATLKRLTGLRTKGMGFGGTDLGRLLDARSLSSELGSWAGFKWVFRLLCRPAKIIQLLNAHVGVEIWEWTKGGFGMLKITRGPVPPKKINYRNNIDNIDCYSAFIRKVIGIGPFNSRSCRGPVVVVVAVVDLFSYCAGSFCAERWSAAAEASWLACEAVERQWQRKAGGGRRGECPETLYRELLRYTDIGRLLSLASSSLALLALPQTNAPDAGLPRGDERSEQFVAEVSKYFETLDSIQVALRSSLAYIRAARISPAVLTAPPAGFVPPPQGVGLPAPPAPGGQMLLSDAGGGGGVKEQTRGLLEERVERDAWRGVLDAFS